MLVGGAGNVGVVAAAPAPWAAYRDGWRISTARKRARLARTGVSRNMLHAAAPLWRRPRVRTHP